MGYEEEIKKFQRRKKMEELVATIFVVLVYGLIVYCIIKYMPNPYKWR